MRLLNARIGTPVAVGLAAALSVGSIAIAAFPEAVSAQVTPTASATPSCVNGVGTITVTVSEPGTDDFDVTIDSTPAGTITGPETTGVFSPYRAGDHAIEVFWNQGDSFLTVPDVLVVCAPVPTTDTSTTTTTAAVAAAVTATTPAFTG
jgi:hypothetical protein